MSTKTRTIRVMNRNAPTTIKAMTSGLKVTFSLSSSGSSVFEASCLSFEPVESTIIEGGSPLLLVLVDPVNGKDVGTTVFGVAVAEGCIMDSVSVAMIGGTAVFPS